MTEIITSLDRWRNVRAELREKSLGLVATMGDLHDGHLSLIHRSLTQNDRTIASVFVNPTQFDDKGDLAAYGRPTEGDNRKLAQAGVDFVFRPENSALYHDDYTYRIEEAALSRDLCGAHRPGHFTGVLTVVMKLLMIVRPTRAYFGEKDFQQYLLVRGMAAAFFLPTEIISCPTVRDPDGLALSSRNARLTTSDRAIAGTFYKTLVEAECPAEAINRLSAAGFQVEYVNEHDGRRFGAVRLGGVRLIDNVSARSREE